MKTLKYVEAELLDLIEQEWESYKKPYLEKNEVEQVNTAIRRYWVQHCGEVPKKVGAVTDLAIAIFETDKEKIKIIIMKSIGIISGLGGVAALVYSIKFFAGLSWWSFLMVSLFGSFLGPIAFAVGGLAALAGGGYLLSRKDSPEQASKKAKEMLIKGMKKVLSELWNEYESKWKD